ncbi:hypothetical protein MNBD_GAMMA08-735 [hydrothermal vent metagenome]|uniref:Uncharacterized protein n=1 Tax=hydrothermal vent metagenome TaxID=652676 RepID=A0A3B0X5R3_9ZZZZ
MVFLSKVISGLADKDCERVKLGVHTGENNVKSN